MPDRSFRCPELVEVRAIWSEPRVIKVKKEFYWNQIIEREEILGNLREGYTLCTSLVSLLYKVDFRFPLDFIETPPLSSLPRVKQYAHTIPYKPLSLSISLSLFALRFRPPSLSTSVSHSHFTSGSSPSRTIRREPILSLWQPGLFLSLRMRTRIYLYLTSRRISSFNRRSPIYFVRLFYSLNLRLWFCFDLRTQVYVYVVVAVCTGRQVKARWRPYGRACRRGYGNCYPPKALSVPRLNSIRSLWVIRVCSLIYLYSFICIRPVCVCRYCGVSTYCSFVLLIGLGYMCGYWVVVLLIGLGFVCIGSRLFCASMYVCI